MRWSVAVALLVMLLTVALCAEARAAAPSVHVSVLPDGPGVGDIDAVRGARGWIDAGDALRWRDDARWWRVDITPEADPARATAAEDWIVSIREAYDAQLVAYAPPDYRPRPLATFDPSVSQIGSRHRLTIAVPADAWQAPVFIELIEARRQPMGVAAQPLSTYLADDYGRVRFSSAVLSAQLLLVTVATIFAFALRRWMLLLFCVWVLSTAAYLVVMRGELVALAPWFPPEHAMRVAGLGISLGLLSAYAFLYVLLQVSRRFPRIARVYRIILLSCAALMVVMTSSL